MRRRGEETRVLNGQANDSADSKTLSKLFNQSLTIEVPKPNDPVQRADNVNNESDDDDSERGGTDNTEFPFFTIMMLICVGLLSIAALKGAVLNQDWKEMQYGGSSGGVFVSLSAWIGIASLVSIAFFLRVLGDIKEYCLGLKHYHTEESAYIKYNRDAKVFLLLLFVWVEEMIVAFTLGGIMWVPIGGLVVSVAAIPILVWKARQRSNKGLQWNGESIIDLGLSNSFVSRVIRGGQDHTQISIDFPSSYWISVWIFIGAFYFGRLALFFTVNIGEDNQELLQIYNLAYVVNFLPVMVVFVMRTGKWRQSHRRSSNDRRNSLTRRPSLFNVARRSLIGKRETLKHSNVGGVDDSSNNNSSNSSGSSSSSSRSSIKNDDDIKNDDEIDPEGQHNVVADIDNSFSVHEIVDNNSKKRDTSTRSQTVSVVDSSGAITDSSQKTQRRTGRRPSLTPSVSEAAIFIPSVGFTVGEIANEDSENVSITSNNDIDDSIIINGRSNRIPVDDSHATFGRNSVYNPFNQNSNNTNARNTEAGNVLQSIEILNEDLCLHLFGSALGYPVIVGINYFYPKTSLLIFLGIAILFTAIWWWLKRPRIDDSNKIVVVPDSSETEPECFPEDTYSFIAVFSWRKDNNLFCFGLVVFILQALMTTLMMLSALFPRWRSGEVDNPASDGSLIGFFPANANILVRATQFVSILVFVLFPEETMSDITESVKMFPTGKLKGSPKLQGLALACTLRFMQGMLAIIAVFLLVMNSADVNEIILNFTAINFISKMDEVGFHMAAKGNYGVGLEKAAKKVKKTEIPNYTYDKSRDTKRHIGSVMAIAVLLLGLASVVMSAQDSPQYWTTKTVRVQFTEKADKSLAIYNGCYRIGEVDTSLEKRMLYDSYEENEATAKIGYCRLERRWLLYNEEEATPCEVVGTAAEIARSPKSDFFDIGESLEEQWLDKLNVPIGLTFLLDENVENTCDSILNDGEGRCDPVYNTATFDYDNGDCCAHTCKGPSCGAVEDDEDEIEYPDCFQREGLVPISIRLGLTPLEITNDTGVEIASPWDVSSQEQTHLVEFECKERTVFKKHMKANEAASGMVPIGENCLFFLTDPNATSSFTYNVTVGEVNYHAHSVIDYLSENNYLIYQGRLQTNSTSEPFEILSESFVKTDSAIPSEIGYLTNLDTLSLAGHIHHPFTGSIPTEIGLLTKLRRLDLADLQLTGAIPAEIGLLTNLESINLNENQMTGTIPANMGLLSNLKTLDLSDNQFSGTIPTEIGLLTNLHSLFLHNNDLTGDIPTEISLLTNLESRSFPIEIGFLTNLQSTSFPQVDNDFTGTDPSDIALLQNTDLGA